MYNSPFEYVGWLDVPGVVVEVKVMVVRQLGSLGVMVVVTLHSLLATLDFLSGPAEGDSTNSISITALNAKEQTLAYVKLTHIFTEPKHVLFSFAATLTLTSGPLR